MGETETFCSACPFKIIFSEQYKKSCRKMIICGIIFGVIVFVAAPGGSVGYIHEITIYDFITKT